MDGTFVKELDERLQEPSVLTVGDQRVVAAPATWKLVDPASIIKPGPTPDPLAVSSLGGLRDYLVANRDLLDLDITIVHVVSPQVVRVVGDLEVALNRHTFLEATVTNLTDGFLGKYHLQDEFIIGLQTRFAASDGRAAVLRVIGVLKNEQIATSADDGITQTVETRAGIALARHSEIPNPIMLTPYRTFREVTQPESWFVLRVQAGRSGLPEIGLFEADGGAWRLTAVERIRDWLRLDETLPKGVAILA
jgi:hypothetical protein